MGIFVLGRRLGEKWPLMKRRFEKFGSERKESGI